MMMTMPLLKPNSPLKTLRERRGMSVEEFAELTDLPVTTVIRLEFGRLDQKLGTHKCLRIAKVLGLPARLVNFAVRGEAPPMSRNRVVWDLQQAHWNALADLIDPDADLNEDELVLLVQCLLDVAAGYIDQHYEELDRG